MQTAYKTCQEVAAHFQVKNPTVRLWTRQGVPCLRAGRLVRFKLDEVEAWLRARGNGDEGAEVGSDGHSK